MRAESKGEKKREKKRREDKHRQKPTKKTHKTTKKKRIVATFSLAGTVEFFFYTAAFTKEVFGDHTLATGTAALFEKEGGREL